MDEWIKAYQQKCSGATINYEGTGSGAGIQAFIAGTADFAGSDSALKDGAEQPQADARCAGGTAIHLPMVIGPIAVVYNVEGVDGLQLKPATLAKIFAGKITKWDDAAIKADNPSAKLPSTTIQPVHRSDESGTTDNFTKYLSKAAPSRLDLRQRQGVEGSGRQRGQGLGRRGRAGQERPTARSATSSGPSPEPTTCSMAKIEERRRRVRRADRRGGRQDHRRRQGRRHRATT